MTTQSARILQLEVLVAELAVLVGSAYSEGFSEGMREHTTSRGGLPWVQSKTRKRLIAITQATASRTEDHQATAQGE